MGVCFCLRELGHNLIYPYHSLYIINPGFNIPAICEKRLQLACFAARTYDLIGRALSQDALNRDRLKIFEHHYKLVTENKSGLT